MHQLVYALHLHQNLLHSLKKLSLDDQQLLKRRGWVLVIVVIDVARSVALVICDLNNRG
jgi:ribosomal protein L36